MIVHISCFQGGGPYFPPTVGLYQAASLSQLLFHTRLAMEDGEYLIGIFDDNGQCKGIWEDCAEAVPDGEGGMILEKPSYLLHRPHDTAPGMWNLLVSKLKRPRAPM